MLDKLDELIEEIKNLSKTEYYQIKITKETPEIFDSKIGGLPYWSEEKNYPTNSEGKKLFLLAQINFERENVKSPLPTNGILQFFINNDILMGVDYKNPTKQNNFRVIYHDKINYNINKDSIKKLDIPSTEKVYYYPVYGEYKISLNKNIEYVNYHDIKFDKFFSEAYKKVFKKALKEENYCYFKVLNIQERDEINKELKLKGINHKMLGYSYFTQEDPRYNKKYIDYDTLLLQIDSEAKFVMWGDVGIGNFFIPKKSLIEKDFSNVLYNWDCS